MTDERKTECTEAEKQELLEQLHVIEREAHRERIVHWGPRTLDLDILLYDDIIFDSDVLHIPDVEMH